MPKKVCSFCGRSETEVKILISGLNGHICEDCVSVVNAAISGAEARLRPILMTSLALIIGLLPMMFASGVGANGNRALGVGSIGGMLIGMILQLLVVPALFVAFQLIQEKVTPMKWKDTDNAGIESEIEQYSR